MVFQTNSYKRILKIHISLVILLQAGMIAQKVLRHYLKPHLLHLTAIFLFVILSIPWSLKGQEIITGPEIRLGYGVANQKWMPYATKELMIKGDPLRSIFLSVTYSSEINRLLVVRKGMAFKIKGTRNVETPNHYWRLHSLSSPIVLTTYGHPTLSAIGTLLFFPIGQTEGKLYLSSGLSIDYLLKEKPKVHEVFPYDVEVYFDESDYRKTVVMGTFGVGFELLHNIFLEFEYGTGISSSMNVRQMQIKDNYYSFSLVFRAN